MLTALVGYAATALGYLAERGAGAVQVREIARECGIPAPYLAKIVRTLSAKGIVTTQRGVGGGVVIAPDAAKMTLHELCAALEEPFLTPECMLGQDECNDDNACPAHDSMTKIRALQIAVLQRTTIAQIGAFDAARSPARARRRRKP